MVTIPKGVPPVNAVFDIARENGNSEQQRERSNARNNETAYRYLMEGEPAAQGLPVPEPTETPQDAFAGLPVHPEGSTSELVRLRSVAAGKVKTTADEAIRQYQAHQGLIVKL